jgi:hypothetical protein
MSLDLNKLENKLDEALSNETSETLTKFLNNKRMTNNKQQTAVEWLVQNLHLHNDVYFVTKDKRKSIEQAKEMEKQQIINAFWNGDNTDCTSEQNIEEFADQYYNETYGDDKQ